MCYQFWYPQLTKRLCDIFKVSNKGKYTIEQGLDSKTYMLLYNAGKGHLIPPNQNIVNARKESKRKCSHYSRTKKKNKKGRQLWVTSVCMWRREGDSSL